MSLPLTSEEQVSPEVKNTCAFLGENWGFVPNHFLALGSYPQFLQDQVNLFTHLMFQENTLPKIVKEQIALVVSGINLSTIVSPRIWKLLARHFK